MPGASSHEVTQLLLAWGQGEQSALKQLMPVVYQELHRIAHRYMRRETPGHILQTTALLNEAYLRLTDSKRLHWKNRAHFYAICAQLMRQILVDFARSWRSQKRGGNQPTVCLDEALVLSDERDVDLVALDDALKALSKMDERKSRVVELRFFGGLDVRETAEVLKVSEDTVTRDWRMARAWLMKEINGKQAG